MYVEYDALNNDFWVSEGRYTIEQLKQMVAVLDNVEKFTNKDIVRSCYNCLRAIRGNCTDVDNLNCCLGHLLCTDLDNCATYDRFNKEET